MRIENRKNLRREIRQPAMMFTVDGSQLGMCLIVDASTTGAKLEPQVPIEIPDEFFLLLTRDGAVNRRCKIAWRSKDAVGVRFVAA